MTLLFVESGQIMSASSRSSLGATTKLIVFAAFAPSGGIGWLAGGALTFSVTVRPIWNSGPIRR